MKPYQVVRTAQGNCKKGCPMGVNSGGVQIIRSAITQRAVESLQFWIVRLVMHGWFSGGMEQHENVFGVVRGIRHARGHVSSPDNLANRKS